MSDADLAYAAAVAEIARVRAEGRDRLDLSGEAFHALTRIPEEIADWSELQRLDLSETNIGDAGLTAITRMTGLKDLALSSTQITDLGLEVLAGLTGLENLNLSFTRVSDAGMDSISEFNDLEVLDLLYTQITHVGLLAISGMTSLRDLYLSGNKITDGALHVLASMDHLNSLFIPRTQITDAGLAELAKMKGLRFLYLSDNDITDIGLAALSRMSGLYHLSLSNTKVTDAGMASIKEMINLTQLELRDTKISEVGLTSLAEIMGLRNLGLGKTNVRDLRPIRDLPLTGGQSFEGLVFSDTPAVRSDENLAQLVLIEDHAERTAKTLEYLKSLPPYPEPLPWQREMPAPPSDPALPMQITDQGISLASARITVDETDDPIRDTLHRSLQEQVADLLRIAGNLDENAYRKACQLRDLLEVGLNAMNPLQVHLAIEALRRIKTGLGTNADRDLREAIAGVLEIGPGLTLDTKEVQLHLDRSRRNLLEQRTQAEIEAEIRLAMSIGQTDLSGDDIKEIARFAATEAVDQFTAMRPTLTKNYVILAATFVLAQASGGIISNEAVVLWQNAQVYQWLSANTADLRILLNYWGEPFLVWLSPLLDQARFMVESGKHIIKKLQ